MPPTAPSVVYVTRADLDDFLSPTGVDSRVDDDSTGAISAADARALDNARYWATGRVNMHALGRYAAADLGNSWVVNQWAVVLACHWLSCRRGNPPPGSFDKLYDETVLDLKELRAGTIDLPDVGLRSNAYPAWSNIRCDIFYGLRKLRVERPISRDDPTAGPFRSYRDVVADLIPEPN